MDENHPLAKITRSIEDTIRKDGPLSYRNGPAPFISRNEDIVDAPFVPRNEDVPRAGELSSQVFNDLTARIISELQETVESQINDAVNRRAHAIAQMESLKDEIDKVFIEYEANARRHQEKINGLAESVRKKVRGDTEEMIALSNRLREFADQVNFAHEKFFK